MDEYYNVKRLALILAENATMEGMKAENKRYELLGRDMVYGEAEFQEVAERLRMLAYKHNEQL